MDQATKDAYISKMKDGAMKWAEAHGIADLVLATRAAKQRGYKGIGTIAEFGGLFSVVITNFYGRKSVIDYLTGALTKAEAIEFLNGLPAK